MFFFFFFQAEDGIRDLTVTGVQTCALPIWGAGHLASVRPEQQEAAHRPADHRPAVRGGEGAPRRVCLRAGDGVAFEAAWAVTNRETVYSCHCEERYLRRSNLYQWLSGKRDCFAALAMT